MQEEIPENRRPAPGKIWQCGACGKRAEDSYGILGWHSYGWDESCALNCHQVPACSFCKGWGWIPTPPALDCALLVNLSTPNMVKCTQCNGKGVIQGLPG